MINPCSYVKYMTAAMTALSSSGKSTYLSSLRFFNEGKAFSLYSWSQLFYYTGLIVDLSVDLVVSNLKSSPSIF